MRASRTLLRHGSRVAITCVAIVVLAAPVSAVARTVYGMLYHYELCDAAGRFVSIASIAVDPARNMYVTDSAGTVWQLSSSGKPRARVSSGPRGMFRFPVVANGLAGVVYVADQTYRPQLLKYTAGGDGSGWPVRIRPSRTWGARIPA